MRFQSFLLILLSSSFITFSCDSSQEEEECSGKYTSSSCNQLDKSTWDVTEPTLVSVTSPASDGVYVYGDNITINVKLSESVKVDTFGGIPKLKVETGFVDQYATYSSGSGTDTLSFIYNVGAQDKSIDFDYHSISAFENNGGAIYDSSQNFIIPALPSPGASGSMGANKSIKLGGWYQQAYIKAGNSGGNDEFGYSVALDKNTLVVGAWKEDSNMTTITSDFPSSNDNANNSGAVYVYKRTGNIWAFEAFIKASNNDTNDLFGSSVAID